MSVKKLTGNSIIYFLSNFLQKGFGLIVLPLLTQYLSVEEYGDYATITSLISLFTVFFTWGTESALTRFYYDNSKNSDKSQLLSTITIFVVINSMFLLTVLVLSKDYLFPAITDIEFFPYLALVILILTFDACNNIYLYSLYSSQNGKKVAYFNLLKALFNLLMLYILLVEYDLSLLGALSAMAVTSFLFYLFSLKELLYNNGMSFNGVLMKQILYYSLPILPGYYIGYLTLSLDRIWLNKMHGSESVALFDVALKIGGIVQLLVISINLAFKPWLFENFKKIRPLFDSIGGVIISLYLVFGVLIIVTSELGIDILISDDAYSSAAEFVPFIVCAWIFRGYGLMLTGVIHERKNLVKYSSFVVSVLGLIGLSMTYFLIDTYGAYGAAWSKLVIFLLIPFGYWLIIWKFNLVMERVWLKYLVVMGVMGVFIVRTIIYIPPWLMAFWIIAILSANFYMHRKGISVIINKFLV